MIQKINLASVDFKNQSREKSVVSSPIKQGGVVSFTSVQNTPAAKLASAYQALNGIKVASSVNFAGGLSLQDAFNELNLEILTCKDSEHGIKGEKVGFRMPVSNLVDKFASSLPRYEDAVKTNITVSEDKENKVFTEARTQVKSLGEDLAYDMAVRQPREIGTRADKTLPLKQKIKITLTPDSKLSEDMKERAYVLNTKGNLMAVVEDNADENNRYVLMTDTGEITKKNNLDGFLKVKTSKEGNTYEPFVAQAQEVRERHPQPSVGNGTEIVIGMEEGRFVPEIINSIEEFERKINNGEIVLDTFHATLNANKTQIAMLAGGFGSRAEYTNASSDGIFHGKHAKGAQSTKGMFRTPTGLTPMETTFITLHNAGLLDCSKGVFGIGKNVKFYLNKSGVNKGNGGFTIDLYNKMQREGRDNILILPNDPVSRLTKAMGKAKEIADSGNAAMVMVAKEVDPSLAKDFGVMKLGPDDEILEFVEKPKKPSKSLINQNGNCLANTFQFFVSKEAFDAMDAILPYFPVGVGKEPRDWSKCLTPVLMSLTQNDDPEKIKNDIARIVKMKKEDIPTEAILEAKDILGNQKIIAVPTDEPWADCGSLNQLYHTIMQIASGDFPLEDFERAHVLECIDTESGLVATTPELKEAVQNKYDTKGQVMVVAQAPKIDYSIIDKYADAITINPKAA